MGGRGVVWIRSTYGSIGRAPHLLQLEFFYALLVWRDGRALDSDVVLENSLCRFDRYLIIGLGNAGASQIVSIVSLLGTRGWGGVVAYSITVLETEVKILDIELQVRKNELSR